MLHTTREKLIERLSPAAHACLETAANLCMARRNYEIVPEHVLLAMIEEPDQDFQTILRAEAIDPAAMRSALTGSLEDLRDGNTGRPVFSPRLFDWFREAWLITSLRHDQAFIRTGFLVAALVAGRGQFGIGRHINLLDGIQNDRFQDELMSLLDASSEKTPRQDRAASGGSGASGPRHHTPGNDQSHGVRAFEANKNNPDGFLAKYCIDVTARARSGAIDPVFGRDTEIRQMIDILSRRRKNNPICVGEPGVGKTAVVEGLALKMVAGDVPERLRTQDLFTLDMGLLQAGASVKGEFEKRLNGVIEEAKGSERPIILFIDEAHTLIGAGGTAGGGDAANLLKPALARGELRTIAATTWSEYKKYFEKDAALARRFQIVKLEEPSPEETEVVLHGIKTIYERAHDVHISAGAVQAAAHLSARYISGRYLPDKAVDVLDTACARIKLSAAGKPAPLDDLEQRIASLNRTRAAVERDLSVGSADPDAADRLTELDGTLATLADQRQDVEARWFRERDLVAQIQTIRQALLSLESQSDPADMDSSAPDDNDDASPPRDRHALSASLNQLRAALRDIQTDGPLIHHEVTAETVCQVVADWTGIPVGTMAEDDALKALTLADVLGERIIGQDHALAEIAEGLRAAKSGLNDPGQPMGVFLFVGTSGVGKTETATAVADHMFGGERFMVTINMSEFQEKHSVSRLVGSPPGYVGYGEGGLLTEAVRQRPYSVVLLDEVEKADLNVMNLFYQVFDKGTLSDGEGRAVDFRNTIIFLTSNLATEIIHDLGARDPRPTPEELSDAIRPALSAHFKPALLARMRIVPFFPLRAEDMQRIVRLKLDRIARRIQDNRRVRLTYDDAVIETIAERCRDQETGARNADHIIRRSIIPRISHDLLLRLSRNEDPGSIQINLDPDQRFTFTFAPRG